MIKFFRKIRQKLLSENKFSKYLIYALGEIILVVIGILIAIWVNNRNENQNQKTHFDGILSQIKTNISCDIGWNNRALEALKQQDSILKLLQNKPKNVNPKVIPYLLYFLDEKYLKYNTNSKFLLNQIKFESSQNTKEELVGQIYSYYNVWEEWDEVMERNKIQFLRTLMDEKNIKPYNYNLFQSKLSNLDTTYFSNDDILKTFALLDNVVFKNKLLMISSRIDNQISSLNNRLADATSILSQIEKYNPEINLAFSDIGIIGSALESGWSKSIPMKLIDEDNSIWQIRVIMKKGEYKFRERNSWNRNWGIKSDDDDDSKIEFYGNNFIIENGEYEITLNLNEGEQLIKKIK
ncbi:cadherin repeat domain-containing protein [Psychroserpens sp. MEBiC05023]